MVSVAITNYGLTLFCLIGLGLSIYAYAVELAFEQNPNYKPMCDINAHMSCTKAFKSQYGKGFGLFRDDSFFSKPNSLLGILHYSLIATLTQSNQQFVSKCVFYLVLLSNAASLYFAYILYFKLQSFCIVCVAIYIVNLLTLVLSNHKLNTMAKDEEAQVQRVVERKKKE